MPRAYEVRGGPKLPAALLTQVDDRKSTHSQGRARNGLSHNRKDRRKDEREEKKRQKVQHIKEKRPPRPTDRTRSVLEEEEDENADESSEETLHSSRTASALHTNTKLLKSILKSHNQPQAREEPVEDVPKTSSRPSRQIRERLEVDDGEIAALEKKLGLKKSKTPKQSTEDGLEDLLGGLGDSDTELTSKRKRSDDDEWLRSKRQRMTEVPRIEEDDHDEKSALDTSSSDREVDVGDDDSLQSLGKGEGDHDLNDDSEDFEELDSIHSSSPPPAPPKKTRENPYVAPQVSTTDSTAKYIPPSRRGAPANDSELDRRLRRQLQGLLNKLSEANLLSILSEIDKLFQTNPRQYVTSNLINLLLGLICDRTALNDTFIVLHAAFIAATYKIIGQDFGAQIIEQSISRFDKYYNAAASDGEESKEFINMVSLLSQLYNFQLIASDLIFDLIRTFLETLTETHTELLLRIIRSSGSQLRQDDPSSLKDIVLLLGKTVSQIPSTTLSVRTRFMIDTITDLKNNRPKAGIASSAVTAEQLSRMRKTLGLLGTRHSTKASEPLRLTLSDIRNADKKGKWWLIGASWKGTSSTTNTNNTTNADTSNESNTALSNPTHHPSNPTDPASPLHLTHLARTHNMTTPIRRSIFLTLLTSTDYSEAYTRLLKLNLTHTQALEIPRVILHCVATEAAYNPYYALVAGKLCEGDKRRAKEWAFAGMGVVGRVAGGDGGEDVDVQGGVGSVRAVVQLAKFFAALMAKGAVGVGMLKIVEWRGMGGMLRVFVEVLIVSVVLGLRAKGRGAASDAAGRATALRDIFLPAVDHASLADGLRKFLRKRVAKTDLVRNEKERRRVEEGVAVLLAPQCLGGMRRGALEDEKLSVDDF